MPPRFAYWTILLDGKPTAFRAHTREELLPTLRQLQARHPDAVMLWFARGRLWQSPEEERAAAQARRAGNRERRGPAWRPGGEHRDPRDRFKVPRDEKRRRFAAKARRERDQERGGPPPSGEADRFRPRRPDRQRPETHGWRPRGARGPEGRKSGGSGRGGSGGGHGRGGRGRGGGGRGGGGRG